MTEPQARHLLTAVFSHAETEFLFAHPRFKEAVAQASESQLHALNELGVKLILSDGYRPPAAEPARHRAETAA